MQHGVVLRRIGITTGASRKIATRVATPARLRAMAARERHVGRIVGRAGAIAGLRAADTWPTKAVLTRFMSAPVPEHHRFFYANARSKALREADVVLVVGTRPNYVFGHGQTVRFTKTMT